MWLRQQFIGLILAKQTGLFFQLINQIPTSIDNGHIDGDTAVQAVSGAAQSWIIGTDCHLHFVQDSLIIDAVFDQCRGGLFDR